MNTKGDALAGILEEVMGWTLALMLVLVFGNVVLRYGFNSGITVSEELSRYLFVWLTFIGAVAGLKRRQHLGLDTLIQRMPAWGRSLAAIVGHLVMLLCCAVLAWGSLVQVKVNWETRSPVMEIPMSVIYAAAVFGGIAMSLILAVSLYRLLTGKATAEDLRMSTDEAEQASAEVELVAESIERNAPSLAGSCK